MTPSVTPLPKLWMTFATMLRSSRIFSRYKASPLISKQRPLKIKPDWILERTVCGKQDSARRFSMSKFSILSQKAVPSQSEKPIPTMNRKKLKYEQRIVEVENASFNPLIFACTGGAGPTATKVMKRLTNYVSEKMKAMLIPSRSLERK